MISCMYSCCMWFLKQLSHCRNLASSSKRKLCCFDELLQCTSSSKQQSLRFLDEARFLQCVCQFLVAGFEYTPYSPYFPKRSAVPVDVKPALHRHLPQERNFRSSKGVNYYLRVLKESKFEDDIFKCLCSISFY